MNEGLGVNSRGVIMIVRDALGGAKGPRKPAAAPDTLSGTPGHSPPARAPHPGTLQSVFWDAGSHPSLKFTAYLFSAKVASFFVRHFLVTGSHRATGPDGDAACEEEGGCHGCPRGRRPRERTVLRAGLGPRAPSSPAAPTPSFPPSLRGPGAYQTQDNDCPGRLKLHR